MEITKEFLEGCLRVNQEDLVSKMDEASQAKGAVIFIGQLIEYVEKESEPIADEAKSLLGLQQVECITKEEHDANS